MPGWLLIIGGLGACIAAWGASRGARAARLAALAGTVALLAVLAFSLAARAPGADEVVAVASSGGAFDGRIVLTGYMRLVIALWALDAAIVIGLAWLLGGLPALRGLLAGTLIAIVLATVALGATDLVLGVVAGAGTGLAAVAVVLASDRAAAIRAAAHELRVSLGAGALLLVAVAVSPVAAALSLAATSGGAGVGGGVTAAPVGGEAGGVLGLASLAIAFGVAIRLGIVPFHLRVPRLTDVVSPAAVPLLIGWIPLPLAVAGLAVIDHLVSPLALNLEGERWIMVLVAMVTLGAAALAAYLQDDLRHAVGYLVIADGGLVLLGFAALDPGAWGPARVWLVVLAASKTALAAWSAVAESRFGTRSLPDIRGWVRRSPILAAGFVLTAVATFGLPGWVAFQARGDLARFAAAGPVETLLILAGFLTLPTYLRVLAIGFGPASSRVNRAAPERITRALRRRETLDVVTEGAAPATAGGAPVVVATGVAAPNASVADSAAVTPSGADDAAVPSGPDARSVERSRAAASRRARRSAAIGASAWGRVMAAVHRDRSELMSAAVLALAILATLTSWGALDLGAAASEPAPIVSGPSAD